MCVNLSKIAQEHFLKKHTFLKAQDIGPFHPKTTFFSHGSWILVFLAKTISVHPYEMFGGDFGPFGLILAELWPLKGPKMAKNTNLHRTFSPRCNVGLVIWGVIPGNLGYFQDAFSKKQKF